MRRCKEKQSTRGSKKKKGTKGEEGRKEGNSHLNRPRFHRVRPFIFLPSRSPLLLQLLQLFLPLSVELRKHAVAEVGVDPFLDPNFVENRRRSVGVSISNEKHDQGELGSSEVGSVREDLGEILVEGGGRSAFVPSCSTSRENEEKEADSHPIQ